MNYQIKVIECKAAGLETALNQPASEGWQLISCWPDGTNVRAVFQREARAAAPSPAPRAAAAAVAPAPTPPRSAPAPAIPAPATIPADANLLDAVIAACNAQPAKLSKKGTPLPPGIGLAALGKTWGISAQQVREKLHALGVKEKEGPQSKDHWHGGFFIWLQGDFVNIREVKKKSPACA